MKSAFIWAKEPFIPNSLYKRYVFIGEVASAVSTLSDIKILDLSVTNVTKRFLAEFVSDCDYVFIPVEVYTVREAINLKSYISNYSRATVVAYGTASIYNPSFLSKYFDIVIASGLWNEVIQSIITKQFDKLDICQNIYKLKKYPSSTSWYYPLFDKLPMDKYIEISRGEVDLSVQIGCPFNCSFCSEKVFHPHGVFFQRPVEDIINFINKYDYHDIFFDATTFTADRKWVLNLCDALVKNNKKVKWRTVSRVDKLDDEICQAMKNAGCYQVGLGIETLSPNVQKSINKEIDSHIAKAINCLQNNGIEPRLFFILGLPGQTLEDVNYALEFTKEHKFKSRWKEYIPLKETSHFNSVEQYDVYRTDQFFIHHVENMTRETYMKVLLKNERI